MGDGRDRALVGPVASVLVLAVVLAACGAPSADTGPLQAGGVQPAAVTKLPGGGRVAVGSPDGHDVVVQWQAKGSDGWSDPRTVYTEPQQFTHDIEVEAAGDTVVIGPDFWTQRTLDDDYAPNHSAQVVCRDRVCATGHRTPDGVLSSTELNRDGTYATFSLGGRDLLVWDDGEFSTEKAVGLPKDATTATLPDGTLVAVAPQQHRTLCRFRLLTAAKGTSTYVERAVSGDHPALLPCSVSGVDVTDEKVSVLLEELPDPIDFRREDGRWVADEPEAPLKAYPDTGGRSSLANEVVSRSDGSDVSIGSPDTQRIMAQFRAKGATEWSTPVQVATAPPGTSCRFQDVERDDAVTTDLIDCFDDARPFVLGTTEPVAGIALASADGRTWSTATLRRPHDGVTTGPDHATVFTGADASYRWTPDDGMRRIDLPAAPRDVVVAVSATTVVRVVADVTGGTDCRPGHQVADLDATSWPAARPLPGASGLDLDGLACTPYVDILDGEVRVTIGDEDWTGTLSPRGGDWVARKVTYRGLP
ncbi:hypothetical protein [Aeromicrobium sp. Root472D3]|uniref:hypothetical protein n=1 Tax=Aeromicrobium sp. Root472D3 TaxID=1736540 RepID=UPI0006F69C0C|nr:hypothetical protein [Aeromicrobium sp. Root472D3]KQX75197.1 hypothetical protein ASD10_08390 [Aeromicrobium sp. Root472D3]